MTTKEWQASHTDVNVFVVKGGSGFHLKMRDRLSPFGLSKAVNINELPEDLKLEGLENYICGRLDAMYEQLTSNPEVIKKRNSK